LTWEWCHSPGAYEAARENLANLDRAVLRTIFAEWEAAPKKHRVIDSSSTNMSMRKYERALKRATTLPDDILVDFIWEKMEEFRTCTNGGWRAWCCPYGCGPHLVSFDPPEEKQESIFDEDDNED
jgi:hypothetical protein